MTPMNMILLEKMEKADMVLIGIGEELSADRNKMMEIPKYGPFMENMTEEEKWMVPFMEKLYLRDHPEERIQRAYEELEIILKGKNYFIVSTNSDDYIYDTKLDRDRLVTPCGGYRQMQCESGCRKELTECEDGMLNSLEDYLNGKSAETPSKPLCPYCGAEMVFNRVEEPHYLEEGYMEQWKHYKKWLQGTVNRDLCVLELGVGMRFPTVIRWPFEKIVFFNQKASLFRVHSKLYQLTEEIKDRGYSVREDPAEFLTKGFV